MESARATGCARRSTRTRRTRTASSRRAALAQHYGRAGYDVVALTDHWHRSEAPVEPRACVVLPGRRAELPPARRTATGTCSGSASSATRPSSRASGATSRRPRDWIVGAGGVAYLAHPVLDRASAPAGFELPPSVTGIEVFNAGCELEVGRGLSSVHWDELLQDGRSCPALVTDDSHHPGFDSDHAWTWLRAERTAARACSTRCARAASTAAPGPVIHDVEAADGEVVVRCTPSRSVTLLTGKTSGTAVNAGRLGYRYGAEILDTTADGLIVAARLDLPRDGAVRARRGRRPDTAARRGRTRCGRLTPGGGAREALARTSFDLLVIGGGVIGAATAAHAAREGLSRRARRRRRLRLRDVERVVEADPRRSALPPARRRAARPRGAPRAAHADRPAWRRTSCTGCRSSCRSTGAAPSGPRSCRAGSCSTRRSRARASTGSSQPDRAGRSSSPRSVATAFARARSTPTRGRTTRGSASRTSSRPRQARRHGPQPGGGRLAVVSTAGRWQAPRSSVDGETVDVRARVVVNAAGPWVDHVRRLEDPRAGTSVRLSKGAHVLVPGGEDWTAALTVPQDDVRVTFAVPVVRAAPARDDRHGLRGRPGGRRGRGGRRRRRSSARPATALPSVDARSRRRARRVRGAPRAAARRRRDGDRAARDGVLRRHRRDAQRRRREADDVPARSRSTRSSASASRSGSRRVDRRPFPLPGARGAAPELPVEVDPEVEAHLRHLYGSRAGPRRRARGGASPRCSSGSIPTGRTSSAQAGSRSTEEWATTATTSFAAGRRSRSAASPTRTPSRRVERLCRL